MVDLKITRQMQYIILGVILACGALFAVIRFIIVPLVSDWRTNLEKAREIQAEMNNIRAVIRTRQEVQHELEITQDKIREMAAHIPLPVLGNYLLGMEENIHSGVGDLDVQINQVVDQDILQLDGSEFNAYRVRVTAQAGFYPLICLFQNLENNNPLCSISGLTITQRENKPDKHNVIFAVSWLIWTDPTQRPDYLIRSELKEQKSGL